MWNTIVGVMNMNEVDSFLDNTSKCFPKIPLEEIQKVNKPSTHWFPVHSFIFFLLFILVGVAVRRPILRTITQKDKQQNSIFFVLWVGRKHRLISSAAFLCTIIAIWNRCGMIMDFKNIGMCGFLCVCIIDLCLYCMMRLHAIRLIPMVS